MDAADPAVANTLMPAVRAITSEPATVVRRFFALPQQSQNLGC